MTCPAHALAASRHFLEAEDVDLIRELVRRIRRRHAFVVDLGAGSGTTALACFAERSQHITVLTVDISADALAWAGKAVENIGRLADWTSLQGDAVHVGLETQFTADLLLLDTSHEFEATLRELTAWLPHLRGRRQVWCHDYVGSRVKDAVDQLLAADVLKTYKVQGLGWSGWAL